MTVGVQNKGKIDTTRYSWELGNIIDSEGRNFIPINERAYYWLPQPDQCGAVLKPAFTATPCARYYEVSKISTGLKLQVMAQGPQDSKPKKDLIDLLVK